MWSTFRWDRARRARRAQLEQLSAKGGWVMLQNVHLMQSWVPRLERGSRCAPSTRTRTSAATSRPSRRRSRTRRTCLSRSCSRASRSRTDAERHQEQYPARVGRFSQDRLDACEMKPEFRGRLLLCFFHAAMLGRKRRAAGLEPPCSFNMGDLTICADVLQTYLNDCGGVVPWQDLRIFGEIMYGGHITGYQDRTVDTTYLEVIFTPNFMEMKEYGRLGLKAPNSTKLEKYDDYLQYLETDLPPRARRSTGCRTRRSRSWYEHRGGLGHDPAAARGLGRRRRRRRQQRAARAHRRPARARAREVRHDHDEREGRAGLQGHWHARRRERAVRHGGAAGVRSHEHPA